MMDEKEISELKENLRVQILKEFGLTEKDNRKDIILMEIYKEFFTDKYPKIFIGKYYKDSSNGIWPCCSKIIGHIIENYHTKRDRRFKEQKICLTNKIPANKIEITERLTKKLCECILDLRNEYLKEINQL